MAELNGKKIYEKLDIIDGKVDEILLWKAAHITAHGLIERDVADNRAVLFENPGVISKLNTLWNCKSNVTEWKRFWLEIFKYLIVAGVVAVVTWLLLLYKSDPAAVSETLKHIEQIQTKKSVK